MNKLVMVKQGSSCVYLMSVMKSEFHLIFSAGSNRNKCDCCL